MKNKTNNTELKSLGDVIGGANHFGGCFTCGTQFLSTHDRVHAPANRPVTCAGCGPLPAKAVR